MILNGWTLYILISNKNGEWPGTMETNYQINTLNTFKNSRSGIKHFCNIFIPVLPHNPSFRHNWTQYQGLYRRFQKPDLSHSWHCCSQVLFQFIFKKTWNQRYPRDLHAGFMDFILCNWVWIAELSCSAKIKRTWEIIGLIKRDYQAMLVFYCFLESYIYRGLKWGICPSSPGENLLKQSAIYLHC